LELLSGYQVVKLSLLSLYYLKLISQPVYPPERSEGRQQASSNPFTRRSAAKVDNPQPQLNITRNTKPLTNFNLTKITPLISLRFKKNNI